MNERIKELADKVANIMPAGVYNIKYDSGKSGVEFTEDALEKFAELIIKDCIQLLFAESERLYTYSSECDDMHDSDEAELCAEKCMDNIQMIEEHFGVEK